MKNMMKVLFTLLAGCSAEAAQTSEQATHEIQQGTIELEAAKLIIEHNSTDEDTGFQGFVDGEAWNQLQIRAPDGTLETLLKPENKEKLRRILTYHVVSGKVMASDVVKLQSAKAVSGDTITVKVRNDVVHVDNATVTKADVTASNGVIHVIDAVILPKGI